ncbi:MAG TPA: GAF and ANTAR domain-containing protein [Actinocrinis sp.]|nr:GAF and ANTAR domain-containing protein [Actinocrinis sp.]
MAADERLDLVRKFARAAQDLSRETSQERLQRRVVELAVEAVEGVASAGVTVLGGAGRLRSVAFTDETVRKVDQAQAESGQGPCLDAARSPGVVWIEDMAAERRWPRFTPRARRLGVGAMVSCGLPAGNGRNTFGALNLHAWTPGAIGPQAVEIAQVFATHAAIALRNVALMESLRTAMHSRQRIGEATGIVLERHRTDSAQAFELLVSVSQNLNVKLRDLSEYVVLTGQDPLRIGPDDLPPGYLR